MIRVQPREVRARTDFNLVLSLECRVAGGSAPGAGGYGPSNRGLPVSGGEPAPGVQGSLGRAGRDARMNLLSSSVRG